MTINWTKVDKTVANIQKKGGSVPRYLEKEGISYSTYYYHAKRRKNVSPKTKGEFVEFTSTKETPITLTTADGITISVPAGNVTALKTALAALREE